MPETQKVVVIDGQAAGVSGDMFLGALLDLGANAEKVVSAIKSLENQDVYRNIKIELKPVSRKGFKATQIDTTAEHAAMGAKQIIQIIEEAVDRLTLSLKAKQFASNVVHTLVDAETSLHGTDMAKVHLHEVGLVDTAAEIVGCAVALDDLGLFEAKIYALPVSVGGGLFKFSHGTVSSPAPATLAILQSRNFPFKGGPLETELATPTGAAILVNLAAEVVCVYPGIVPLKVGYGAGTKDFAEIANVLRIVVGKSLDGACLRDEAAVLETNLDDVTGEIVGRTVDRLLQEGAKDVSIIPMFTKKNRPGQILKVVADMADVERLSQVLMEETGTLGVRVFPCQRRILSRELTQVEVLIDGVKQTVNVKVAKNSKGKIIRIKPEYEDLKRIADQTGRPLREIAEVAAAKARSSFQE